MKTFLVTYEIFFDEHLVSKIMKGMGYFKVPNLSTVQEVEKLKENIKTIHSTVTIKNLVFTLIRELENEK